MGERWLLDTCVQVIDSLREELFCVVYNLPPPKSTAEAVLPGRLGLDVSAACSVVAQDGNKDCQSWQHVPYILPYGAF